MNKKKNAFRLLRSPLKRFRTSLLSLGLAFAITIAFWIIEPLVQTPLKFPESGFPAEVYANETGADLTYTFTEAISKAKKSILLMVYTLTDQNIINALKQKNSEGIKVKVITDATASPFIDSKLGSNVDVTRRFGPGIMHLKILVIDDEEIWIGSANMTRESLKNHGNLILGISSKNMAEFITAKADTLKFEGSASPFYQRTFTIGDQSLQLWFLPDNPEASLKIKSLIRSAKDKIRIAMFTWTRYDFAKEVIHAHRRGVDVEVVIDYYQGKGASVSVVEQLKDAGVNVRISKGGALLHHKFMVIDDKTLVNGSANWTKAAFTRNDDCFIVLDPMSSNQKNEMEQLWKKIVSESTPP